MNYLYQYHVQDTSEEARKRFVEVVREVAMRYGFVDNTETSRVIGTLVSLVPGPKQFYGMGIRVSDDRIIVDFLLGEKQRVQVRPMFTKLIVETLIALHATFGEKLIIPHSSEYREWSEYSKKPVA